MLPQPREEFEEGQGQRHELIERAAFNDRVGRVRDIIEPSFDAASWLASNKS
jgi:hypothetical protein